MLVLSMLCRWANHFGAVTFLFCFGKRGPIMVANCHVTSRTIRRGIGFSLSDHPAQHVLLDTMGAAHHLVESSLFGKFIAVGLIAVRFFSQGRYAGIITGDARVSLVSLSLSHRWQVHAPCGRKTRMCQSSWVLSHKTSCDSLCD